MLPETGAVGFCIPTHFVGNWLPLVSGDAQILRALTPYTACIRCQNHPPLVAYGDCAPSIHLLYCICPCVWKFFFLSRVQSFRDFTPTPRTRIKAVLVLSILTCTSLSQNLFSSIRSHYRTYHITFTSSPLHLFSNNLYNASQREKFKAGKQSFILSTAG